MFSYGRLYFTDASIMADKGAAMYQGQVQLASLVQSQFGHLGIILRMSGEPFATLSGKVARIAELDEVMQELEEALLREQQQQQQQHGGSAAHILESSDGVVRFDGVDVVTPRGENVAGKLTVTVTPTTPLMVTGASAAGKSSLVRVLGGLWPMHSGTLTRPSSQRSPEEMNSAEGVLGHPLQSVSIQSIFLVPQKIHMATGSLADQVTYPTKIAPQERTIETEQKLQELLELVPSPSTSSIELTSYLIVK